METNLFTVKNAAPLINCSTITLRRLIHSGQIGYKRIGKRYLFTPVHIQDYLNRVDVSPRTEKAQGVN
jgi:excisionase family DNA binding protein